MPEISRFFGIVIVMHWGEREHPPPHFHARYGDWEVSVDIETLEVFDGHLPRRALNLILDWAELHRAELLANWELAWNNAGPLNPIPPLE